MQAIYIVCELLLCTQGSNAEQFDALLRQVGLAKTQGYV